MEGQNTFGRASTIVTDVTEKMEIFEEESFGPSAFLYIVDDQQDAIKKANDSAYDLTAKITGQSSSCRQRTRVRSGAHQ